MEPRGDYIARKDGRPFDHRILKFRYEVLREDVHSLAESVNVPVEFMSSLARAEQWQRIEIDEAQESRIAEVKRAVSLRLQCLAALRQLDRFYTLANIEDSALQAIHQRLQDPDITPYELARLVNSLKAIKDGLLTTAALDQDALPEPVKAYIDVRKKQEEVIEQYGSA